MSYKSDPLSDPTSGQGADAKPGLSDTPGRSAAIAPDFEIQEVEVSTALEYGTDKPCQIGRLVYKLGVHRYVALTFRYLIEKMPDPWFLTWVGLEESRDTARLPEGVKPSDAMLAALAEATS